MYLSRPRRPRRSHEWSAGKAVTFIVTLAATHSVTLAAREAGMSRKAAYALKARDPAFATAWNAALAAAAAARQQPSHGDETDKPDDPPNPAREGDGRPRAARSSGRGATISGDAEQRDRFFASLAADRARRCWIHQSP